MESLPNEIAQWRLAFFRRQLYIMTYRYFLKERDEIRKLSSDLYADLGMDSNEDQDESKPLGQWPEFFDVNSVPQVRKSELKPRPKLNNFKSIDCIISEIQKSRGEENQ